MNMAIWYENFIVVKNERRKVIRFEAKPGANVSDVINDVVKYLKFHDLDKEYLLILDETEIQINQNSTKIDIVKNYTDNINL